MEPLVTVKDAAAQLAVSSAAIRKWIYQGKLPAVRAGRVVRLRPADLEAFLRRARQ